MSYFKYNVNLTKGQKDKLLSAYQKRVPISLRLKKSQLFSGNDTLILTQRQINKVMKSKKYGVGTDIKISSTQVKQQEGGNILSAFIPAMTKNATEALPYATKAIAPLATGALSGLASLGVNKIFGSGFFSVPQDKVDKLIEYKNYLTTTHKKLIVNALQSGSGLNWKLTKKQQEGGFLLSALASLAIPMVIKAITGKGKGLQVESARFAKGLQIEGPPPFYWQCSSTQGYGRKKKVVKKKSSQRSSIRKKTVRLRKQGFRFWEPCYKIYK